MYKTAKKHDDLIVQIMRYAGMKNVPRKAQEYLLASALEYLAVTRVLPEVNITDWPEKGMIGVFQGYEDSLIEQTEETESEEVAG